MRKLNLLIVMLLLSMWAVGQTYLDESFEGTWSGTPATPSGWSIQHTTATGGSSGTDPIYWAKNTWSGSAWSSTSYGQPNTPTGAYAGSSVAWFNDYNAKSTQKDELRTGDVDLSSSTNPRVTFFLAINASSTVTIKLRGSSDGGATWEDIQTITKPGQAWTKINVAVPGSYKVSNARFGIEVTASWGSNDVWLDKFVIDETPAPLTGIKTIKSSNGDYASFTAAINALNDAGVGTGGVTFNVDADFVSSENCPIITATGTASDPIVFQKSGSGANPKITPTGTTGTTDAGINITGGDYITFDGIDIDASAVTAVEYGYLIRNASATNGAQYNTIKNCNITLNRSNTTSRAIVQTATISLAGGLTPSSAAGANSNNKYQANTIQNTYMGIYLWGSATYPDISCEISGNMIGAASANDIANGSSTANGIRTTSSSNISVFNNTIRNITVTGAVALYGIYVESLQGSNNNIYNNNIYNLKTTSTSTSSILYPIRADINASQVCNIYNNMISGLDHGIASATSTVVIRGIAVGVSGTGIGNLYFNSVLIDENQFPSSTCFWFAGGTVNMKNNNFANTSTAGATSLRFCVYRSSGTLNNVNYNNYFINTTGTNNHVGYFTANRNTLSDWQTATSKDANSKNVAPSFASSTDLHSSSSGLNGAGVTISIANGDALDITTDIDGDTRQSPPDIGADEFDIFDMTSKAEAPTTQVSGTSIASTVTTVGAAVEVFSFNISDLGTSDGKETKVTNIRIQNANPANGASWTANIAGLKLNDGTSDITIGTPTITSSAIDIPITSGNLNIADGGSKTITMSVFLKTISIEDGKKLQFTIPATGHGFASDGSGSLFDTDFGAVITGNEHTITVNATKLVFSGVPTNVLFNTNFSATATATDDNGNLDIDNTASVTVAKNTGLGILSSATGLTQSLVNGTYTWTDLQYSKVETFTIQANGGSLTQAVSGNIVCSNTLIVGTGTSSQAYPFDIYFGFSRNAALYLSSEIPYMTYEKLQWQIATAQTINAPVKIYMKKQAATTITADTWANMISGATLVYDGTLQFTPSGWFSINFTSSFDFDADNLLILTEGNYGGTGIGTYPTFNYSTATNCNASERTDNSPPAGNLTVNNLRPNIRVVIPIDQEYLASNVVQNSSNVNAGALNQQVIGIQVQTAGDLNPLTLTKFTVNANGTTNVSDISNANIYYTGASSTFAATNQFGTTVASPTTSNFDITGSQALVDGTNYFWLTYDVSATALHANVIDAECTQITIDGSDYVPSTTAPAGTRSIVNKTLTSIAGVQASTAIVLQSATNQQVLRLDFAVAGSATGSLLLNSLEATYTGTSTSDIPANGVKLFTTTNTTFSTANPLGTAQSLTGGVAIFGSLNYNLPTGTSYVWVAFDVDAAAVVNNLIDAKIAANGINVAGTTYNPADIDPAGTRTIKTPLNGTFTVGSGGHYTSFTKTDGIFADINAYGFSGNVVINVISDITDETGATALNQWTEIGVGGYTLTIQPDAATLRIISGSYAGGLIRLNGADRVTIDGSFSGDGQYLLFGNTNSTSSNNTIALSNTANNNSIKNCKIYSKYRSITLTTADNTLIEGNDIYGDVAGNTLYSQAGISLGSSVTNTKIYKNSIHDFYYTGTAGWACHGIRYESNAATVTEIINNTIYKINADGWTSAAFFPAGIYIGTSGGNIKIYNNSINLTGNTLTYLNAKSAPIVLNTSVTLLDLRNNALSNSQTGNASNKTYAIYSASANTAFTAINNNNYYVTGVGPQIGFISSDRADLAAWQTATAQDANSMSADPLYTSAADLKPQASSPLKGKGTPLTGVDKDIEGTTRHLTKPSIGAYEIPFNNLIVTTTSQEVTSNVTYDDVVIEPAGELTVTVGNTLTVSGDFIIESDATGTGSFLQEGTIDVTGSIIVQNYLPDNTNTGWYVASPISDASYTTFDGSSGLYTYNSQNAAWDLVASGDLSPMKGYVSKFGTGLGANNKTVEFTTNTGVLNNTSVSSGTLYRTGYNNGNFGWNLVGNPYPSTIDWNAIVGANNQDFVTAQNVNATIYIRKADGGVATFTANGSGTNGGTRYIAPMQAFWVQVFGNASNPTGTGSFSITNNARTHQSTQMMKSLNSDGLRLSIEKDGNSDEMLVQFNASATENFDGAYDAIKMFSFNDNHPQIFSILPNSEELAVNNYPELTSSRTVTLGFNTKVSGLFTITAGDLSTFDSNVSIYLEDTYNNLITDLRQQNTYTFNSGVANTNDRFVLHFNITATDNSSVNAAISGPSIFSYENTVYIANVTDENATVHIYNVLGQEVTSQQLVANTLNKVNTNLATGQYIVKVMSNAKFTSQKVYLK